MDSYSETYLGSCLAKLREYDSGWSMDWYLDLSKEKSKVFDLVMLTEMWTDSETYSARCLDSYLEMY